MKYTYYIKWDNQGKIESICMTPEPNISYTDLKPDENNSFTLYDQTNDFSKGQTKDNYHYVSILSSSNRLYAVSFSEDGGGESYHSYHSLFLMEHFDDVTTFLKNGYFDWHQDSDCEICSQPDGYKRCLLIAKGKLAKNKLVEFSDERLTYVIEYDLYIMHSKKRKLRPYSDSESELERL